MHFSVIAGQGSVLVLTEAETNRLLKGETVTHQQMHADPQEIILAVSLEFVRPKHPQLKQVQDDLNNNLTPTYRNFHICLAKLYEARNKICLAHACLDDLLYIVDGWYLYREPLTDAQTRCQKELNATNQTSFRGKTITQTEKTTYTYNNWCFYEMLTDALRAIVNETG